MFIIAITSILAITSIAAFLRARTPLRLCPICAGVSGTWGWMLVARAVGYAIDPLVLGILMGGSVVGVAYQLEKRLPPGRSPLLLKTIFIPMGMLAVYELLSSRWVVFFAALGVLLIFTLAMLRSRRDGNKESERVQSLEEKMKKCC